MARLSGIHALPLVAALVITVAVPAPGHSDEGRQQPIASVTDGLAKHIATALADRQAREQVVTITATRPADLRAIRWDARTTHLIETANQAVVRAKGLPVNTDSLLRIRLAQRDMSTALRNGETPLVAATPTDDTAARLVAYDPSGKVSLLDPAQAPQRPVLLVEVDVTKAMSIGLRLVQDTLGKQRLAQAPPATSAATNATAASGYWATKVGAVRLSSDEEPWFKGGAEIYAIVGGFGLDGLAKVNIIQMPYLDNDGTTYYPNQLLVHFNGYKYNLADIVMMEDDGDTNYQALATAIANALLAIVDGGVYAPLVNAILNAIPASWWTDDPDYVDSWYTLATTSAGRVTGARANGWMDVSPYWVAPL